MKEILKKIIKRIPVAFTVNQRYDRQTGKVIRRVCSMGSNSIDVGCHKGEILDIILKAAPEGSHYGFEPIPDLFEQLQKKYNSHNNVTLLQVALSNQKGQAPFNYVLSNPAYSGLQKRRYDRPDEKDVQIEVRTDRLDDLISEDLPVAFIKIDVEGGELQVLEGATATIKRSKPVIVFEHGLGASEFYGSGPARIFELLTGCGLQISLMERWLKSQPAFTLKEFEEQFFSRLNFVFIAYP